jgi:hypothetical protein
MTSATAALRRPARAIMVALILAAALVAVVAATTVLRPGGGPARPQAAYNHPHSPGHALADPSSPDLYYHL